MMALLSEVENLSLLIQNMVNESKIKSADMIRNCLKEGLSCKEVSSSDISESIERIIMICVINLVIDRRVSKFSIATSGVRKFYIYDGIMEVGGWSKSKYVQLGNLDAGFNIRYRPVELD